MYGNTAKNGTARRRAIFAGLSGLGGVFSLHENISAAGLAALICGAVHRGDGVGLPWAGGAFVDAKCKGGNCRVFGGFPGHETGRGVRRARPERDYAAGCGEAAEEVGD